ncbi:MAG TPA: hypothetical protein VMS64_04825 [Candidatus Methylomirabilis sp.]|nr:hypothetical protein [Candidatus Methylomirabilis sp.]
MANDKFEQALAALDPSKRALLKRIIAAAAFAVPTISSFAVRDLAAGPAACVTTVTTSVTAATVTKTVTQTTTTASTRTSTITTTVTPVTPPI